MIPSFFLILCALSHTSQAFPRLTGLKAVQAPGSPISRQNTQSSIEVTNGEHVFYSTLHRHQNSHARYSTDFSLVSSSSSNILSQLQGQSSTIKPITNDMMGFSDAFNKKYRFTGVMLGDELDGVSYEAEWLKMNRPVTVKVGEFDADDIESRAFTEVAVWGTIKRNVDGVVTLVDACFEPTRNLYYVMFVTNSSAYLQCSTENVYKGEKSRRYSDYMATHQLSESHATHFLLQLTTTLHSLHTLGIYHGNLRFESVLITRSRDLLLNDFSNANFLPSTHLVSARLSTTFYKSPQAIEWNLNRLHKVNAAKNDVYALGVMYFISLFGYEQFTSDLKGVIDIDEAFCLRLNGFILGFTWANERLSEGARELLRGMLRLDEKRRWKMSDVEKRIHRIMLREECVTCTVNPLRSVGFWERLSSLFISKHKVTQP